MSEKALDAVEENQFVNDACMLVYTSGKLCAEEGKHISALVVCLNGRPPFMMSALEGGRGS